MEAREAKGMYRKRRLTCVITDRLQKETQEMSQRPMGGREILVARTGWEGDLLLNI